MIVRQGAPADKFFIIVDGEVEVVRESEGKTRSLGTLGRGQFFGEIAILRDTPRIATVRAVKPTTLFAMERDIFRCARRPVDGHDRRLRPRHPAASGGARPHDRRLREGGGMAAAGVDKRPRQQEFAGTDFRNTVGSFATGVTVITTRGERTPTRTSTG